MHISFQKDCLENLLVFDNGGWAGYGLPNPASPYGSKNAVRDHSRILEINPVTLEIEWQYTPTEAGYQAPLDSYRFYSPYISSAQRLPNGNTLITEGADGRVLKLLVSMSLYGNIFHLIKITETQIWFTVRIVYRMSGYLN